MPSVCNAGGNRASDMRIPSTLAAVRRAHCVSTRRPIHALPIATMKRAAIERSRTLRTWRSHLRTHREAVLCACEFQPGRFRKSQRVGGCGRSLCWLCHGDKLAGRLRTRDIAGIAQHREGLRDVFGGR